MSAIYADFSPVDVEDTKLPSGLDDFYEKIERVRQHQLLSQGLWTAGLTLAAFAIKPLLACAVGVIGLAYLAYRAALPSKPPYLILSIDGGGVRGIIPAKILALIEEEVGAKPGELFDCIAGTSIGGVLALALSQDRSAVYCLKFLKETAPRIFERSITWRTQTVEGLAGPKYSDEVLSTAVKKELGDARLADTKTDVLVTGVDIGRHAGLVFFHFQNVEAPTNPLLSDVALATSAAPTYFPSHAVDKFNVVDGGLWANNPSLVAYQMVSHFVRTEEDDPVFILSLGTGSPTKQPIPPKDSEGWGIVSWLPRLFDILIEQMEKNVEHNIHTLGKRANIHFMRLQPKLPSPSLEPLDNADPANLEALEKVAKDYFNILLEQGLREKLIDPLKKYRLNCERAASRSPQIKVIDTGGRAAIALSAQSPRWWNW
ncbi:MAG: patatin-like phospholipase family protein [Verrucomicrobia bacterium]|nr:patatin-like phospholipase family protein [Verrucomicrobiota bacterium]